MLTLACVEILRRLFWGAYFHKYVSEFMKNIPFSRSVESWHAYPCSTCRQVKISFLGMPQIAHFQVEKWKSSLPWEGGPPGFYLHLHRFTVYNASRLFGHCHCLFNRRRPMRHRTNHPGLALLYKLLQAFSHQVSSIKYIDVSVIYLMYSTLPCTLAFTSSLLLHTVHVYRPTTVYIYLYIVDVMHSKDQGQNCTSILHPFCTHSALLLLWAWQWELLWNEPTTARTKGALSTQQRLNNPFWMRVELIHWQVHSLMKSWLPHAGTVLQYKDNFQLVKRGMAWEWFFCWRYKYPIQSAGRMAKNGCDSFDLGPKFPIV